MDKSARMAMVCTKFPLRQRRNDLSYWRQQPFEVRLSALDEYYAVRVPAVVDGVTADFIDLEGLKRNKRATGRPQDLADVESLE